MEPLAQKLQAVEVSVPSVKSVIASLQNVLNQDRVDFNTIASTIYDEACRVVGTKELSVPPVVGIQVHRDNVEAESASQYYQRSIFLLNIDGLRTNSLLITIIRPFLSIKVEMETNLELWVSAKRPKRRPFYS